MAELEAEIARPGFWDRGEQAQELLRERTSLQKQVDGWEEAWQELEDLSVLAELGEEGEDEATLAEISELLPTLEQKVAKMEFARMLSGQHDASNAIVSINAGAGGTEAQDWAEMLLRMYLRFCEKRGFRAEITDYQPGEEAGVKGVTFTVEGDYAYGWLRAEIGIHRLVRISPFDSNARRHTSFCSVFVFPEISDEVEVVIDEKDLRVDTYRSSGAGGQHVNTTDSAVRITHLPTGIVVQCQNERSQHKNRASAMKVLRARLFDLKLKEQQAKLEQIAGAKKEIGFGSQIRSYVLQPYQMIKDHRTKLEVGDVNRVLDGDLDPFIKTYLMQKASGTLGTSAAPGEE